MSDQRLEPWKRLNEWRSSILTFVLLAVALGYTVWRFNHPDLTEAEVILELLMRLSAIFRSV